MRARVRGICSGYIESSTGLRREDVPERAATVASAAIQQPLSPNRDIGSLESPGNLRERGEASGVKSQVARSAPTAEGEGASASSVSIEGVRNASHKEATGESSIHGPAESRIFDAEVDVTIVPDESAHD